MFTGIIKATGRIESISQRDGDARLVVRSQELDWSAFTPGESIAVNGVCLTATGFVKDGFETDLSRETLAVTALEDLSAGCAVNLEPALALGERLGGHLVSGHVDCVGRVAVLRKDARSTRLDIELPSEFGRYVARKGSVCVDGVSLTINEVSGTRFGVNIIPHTAEKTIIRHYRQGTRVNIEVDLLMRYLERLVTASADADDALDRQRLEAFGYV